MICPPCAAAADAGQIPHDPCKARCDCQHGRPYEMSPPHLPGYPGYLDALPDDAPERKRLERETGHPMPPRVGIPTTTEETS